MTENNPVTASGATEPTGARTPYYEELRRKLRESLQKKKVLDKNLQNLEEQIFRFENSYLEETTAGNIIRGFDSYIKGSSSTSAGASASAASGPSGAANAAGPGGRRRQVVSDSDRVFSRSSSTYNRESPGPSSSAQTTPSHTTPSASSFHNLQQQQQGHHFHDSRASNQVTPTSATMPGGGSTVKNQKKKRTGAPLSGGNAATEDANSAGEDTKGPKRVRISFGGGGN